MSEELDRLARAAAEYQESGRTVVEVAEWLVANFPQLGDKPFNLAQVLRTACALPVRDLQYITAWAHGSISRETLQDRLGPR
ncbi:MAG: hypothetical protein HOQ36_02745 [Nocardia sp.]|nr:hypothetical protein [Nocardia sp.]NUS91321.1 hypothetical protein [Nocardia sp.]